MADETDTTTLDAPENSGTETTPTDPNPGAQDAVDAAFESAPATPTPKPDSAAPGQATDEGTESTTEDANTNAPSAGGVEAEPDRVARTAALFDQFDKMLNAGAAKPSETAAVAPPAAPPGERTPPAAPAAVAPGAPGADPFAGIMAAATEEYGAPLAEKVVKPLVETFNKEIAKLREEFGTQMGPAKQMVEAVQQARVTAAEQTIKTFAAKFPAIYGKDDAERAKNPAAAKAFTEDIVRGAQLQEYFGKNGQPLSDEDAMAMAHAVRVKGQPVSAAREQVRAELKPRSNQRSAPPASTGGSPDGDWRAEAEAEVAKHFG